MRPIVVLLTLSLALAAAPSPAEPPPASDAAPPSAAAPADLSWMAGHWRGEMGEDVIEEVWLPAAGGELLGMFRWLKGGEVYLYELFTIEPGPDGPLLLLRHFDPGLVAWEEKGEPYRFEPVSVGEGEATFVRRANGTLLTYRRRDDGGLEAVLVDDGDPAKTATFVYRRVE